VGPWTLISSQWNIFDLSHVPVTVHAARVSEDLCSNCTPFESDGDGSTRPLHSSSWKKRNQST